MKIEEAMKKATPGPWETWSIAHPDEKPRPGLVLMPEKANGGGGHKYVSCGGGNVEANAALLAHWYNHGPKLLAAMKNLLDAPVDGGISTSDTIDEAHEAIAAASEVEGI